MFNTEVATVSAAKYYVVTDPVNSTASPAPRKDWSVPSGEIARIAALQDDWDGEGARRIPAGIVATARIVLGAVRGCNWPLPTSITATPAETIVFEWRAGGAYHEIEVERSGRAEYMCIPPNEEARHSTWEFDARPLGSEDSLRGVQLGNAIAISDAAGSFAYGV